MIDQMIKTNICLILLGSLSLKADELNDTHTLIPGVADFSINYLNEFYQCSPTGLIKTKTRKDKVTYECKKKYPDDSIMSIEDVQSGDAEAQRLRKEVKNNVTKGVSYTVEIPLYDADSPEKSRLIAQQQLNNKPYGKYLRMFLPAKIYLSIRPQLANSGEDGEMELLNGGSRGGFFYYHEFDEDLGLTFHYEAGVDWQDHNKFINVSDGSDTNRRLSYFDLKYIDNRFIAGKYWSAYYDIAGFTDKYLAFGAQASGAYSGGPHGSPSGTGRADKMIQFRTNKPNYDATLQAQIRHSALRDWGVDYSYTMAGSFIYKGWENIRLGTSISYGEFSDITYDMRSVGIAGDDWASIIGVNYSEDAFSGSLTLSYTKNHRSDDQGIYFDSTGAELYMRYDIDESIRIAGGGNWLFPKNDEYKGEFSIKNIILSLQYTFNEKNFDDLVYVEVSLPNGKLANGDSKDTRIAIGLRYLLDN